MNCFGACCTAGKVLPVGSNQFDDYICQCVLLIVYISYTHTHTHTHNHITSLVNRIC